jgi:hypothetical protein
MTGRLVAGADFPEFGPDCSADFLSQAAPGMKGAAGRRVDGAGHIPFQDDAAAFGTGHRLGGC